MLDASGDGSQFRIRVRGTTVGDVRLRMPGLHYVRNALAAYCVCEALDVPFAAYQAAMAEFQGVDRRFSVRGEASGVLVVDDYGHHPTEIAATIQAARLFKRRLVVAFQPHRYSRTKDQLGAFAPAFEGADAVFITDIYAAGEKPLAGVGVPQILGEFAGDGFPDARYAPRAELTETLAKTVQPGDLALVFGAGDITKVASELVAALGGELSPESVGPHGSPLAGPNACRLCVGLFARPDRLFEFHAGQGCGCPPDTYQGTPVGFWGFQSVEETVRRRGQKLNLAVTVPVADGNFADGAGQLKVHRGAPEQGFSAKTLPEEDGIKTVSSPSRVRKTDRWPSTALSSSMASCRTSVPSSNATTKYCPVRLAVVMKTSPSAHSAKTPASVLMGMSRTRCHSRAPDVL